MGLTAFNRARRKADEEVAEAPTEVDPPATEDAPETQPATPTASAARKKKAGES